MLLMNSMSNSDRSEASSNPRGRPHGQLEKGRAASRPAILDFGVLEGLQRLEHRLGKSVLPGMFDILQRHLPRSCVRLWKALREDDVETVRQISHKLKSSARCLGLSRLGETCAQLEKDAKSGRMESAERQLAEIEVEYDRAASALEQFMTVPQ